MGVLRSMVSFGAELEELRRALRAEVADSTAGKQGLDGVRRASAGDKPGGDERMVCVTSGISFLGFAIVNRLLARGYTVRLALETQEDLDKLREMEMFGEGGRDGVCAVMANVMDLDSLCGAFDGCTAVFYTSAFADPSGVSGYTKHMAEMEAKVAQRVIEACVRTESVRKCVFTSSLLSCVWLQHSPLNSRLPTIVDESCWSDETLCRDRKLWFALGKTMAEKSAWRAARGRNLKLVTICPALLTGPGFCRRNSTASIAYLKGSQELLAKGLLATVDVGKAAEAHVSVYEAIGSTACGRYICYDHVVREGDEVAGLEQQLGIPSRITGGATSAATTNADHPNWFELCNDKLSRLNSSTRRCYYDVYSLFYS